MATFPHSICGIRFGDHAEQPSPVIARSEVERGIPRQRRTGADTLVAVPCTILFKSRAAAAEFEAWFYGDAAAGGGWFSFTLPRTGQVVTAQVRGGDLGALKPQSPDWEWSERSLVLEYVRQGFTTLAPGRYSIPASQILQVQRASTATFLNAAGVLQTAAEHVARFEERPLPNLITNANNFAAWPPVSISGVVATPGVEGPFGLRDATTLTATAPSGLFQNSGTVISGAQLTGSFWIRRRAGAGQISYQVGDGGALPVTITSAWQRVPVTATVTSTVGRLAILISVAGDAVDVYGAQLEYGAVASAFSMPGLLVEDAATNTTLQSQNLASAPWAGCSRVLAAEFWAGSVPFYEASKLLTTQESTQPNLFPVLAGSTWTMTMALLAGSKDTCTVGFYGSVSAGGGGFWGDPQDCTKEILSGPGTFTLYSAPTGGLWNVDNLSATVPTLLRITRTFTGNMSGQARVYPGRATSTTSGDSVKVTRVQTTQGSTADSYIPTTTAAVTRAADLITVAA